MHVIFFYDVHNPDTRWKIYAAGTVGDGCEEGVGWREVGDFSYVTLHI